MSELMNAHSDSQGFRWQLLTTVSTLVLLTSVAMPAEVLSREDDSDHPTVWIELGGQLERNDGTGAVFAPAFTQFTPTPAPYATGSPIDAQRAPRYSKGGEASITFDPVGTDWVFSAGVRYGRSNGNKHVVVQTDPHRSKYLGPSQGPQPIVGPYAAPQFADTTVRQSESHMVLDFQAGKDVGLGMFGRDSTSIFGFGVRFAQFTSRADVKVRARQNIQIKNLFPSPAYFPSYKFHTYYLKSKQRAQLPWHRPIIVLAGFRACIRQHARWGIRTGLGLERCRFVWASENEAASPIDG